MDSPLARALMKKGLDDEVKVEVPGGTRTYTIIEISYGSYQLDAKRIESPLR
jgi:transcription elongation factor GreB